MRGASACAITRVAAASDDGAFLALRQGGSKCLDEKDRRAEIDRHLPIEGRRGEAADMVFLEDRGIVDEERGYAQPRRVLDQAGNRGEVGKVGLDDDRRPAGLGDHGGQRLGLFLRCVAVDGDRPAMLGEILDDGAADAARAAGDKGDFPERCHGGLV
jgi:hypothetical protein